MRIKRGLLFAVIAISLSGCQGCDDDQDRIRIFNATSGGEIGLAVDGKREGADVDNEPYHTHSNVQKVGHLDHGSVSDSVVCFCRGHPPVYLAKPAGEPGSRGPWTDGEDICEIHLLAPFKIKLEIWVVNADREAFAELAAQHANDVLHKERMGVVLDYSVTNVSSWTNASKFLQFALNDDHERVQESSTGITNPADSALAFNPAAINVYLVDEVGKRTLSSAGVSGFEGGATNKGHTDTFGVRTIGMGSTVGADLLVHELGHCFRLDHTDAAADDFAKTNVMWSDSSSRKYLSEGQVFRAHFDEKSALNKLFGLRTVGSTEEPLYDFNATGVSVSPTTLPREFRLWADKPEQVEIDSVPDVIAPDTEPPDPGPPTDSEMAFLWATVDCLNGRNAELAARIRKRGKEIEPEFIRLLNNGPSREELVAVRAAAGQWFSQWTVPGADLAQFVRSEEHRYRAGRDSAIINALGSVGTRASLDVLGALDNPEDPNRIRIDRAIAAIRKREH